LPAVEEKLTIRPNPLSIMPGRQTWEAMKDPVRETSTTARHSLSEMSMNAVENRMPAPFISTVGASSSLVGSRECWI
jgi:hypothetical protein